MSDEIFPRTEPSERPKYRVPIGMPLRGENTREGALVSVLLHVLLITLLLVPIVFSRVVIQRIEQGAGGAGPAGGGGGGRMGEGRGTQESLHFIRVAPEPPAAVKPAPTPQPTPTPVIPKIPPPQATPPPQPAPEQSSIPAPMQTVASLPGTGAGTGRDGSNGNGPGSGGGVGSGVGTGRGSGVGPGTGGGTQANYSPQPVEFFLPPLPTPANVRGSQSVAEFDVDSTGRVLELHFEPTRDGDYNRKLERVLHSIKFRPGTRPDGTPLRMKAQITISF